MPLEIPADELLRLINRFYTAYDPARQFEEAFGLYQSVVDGSRAPVDVMNALYATYPAALLNLYCQALWRYAPTEMPGVASPPAKTFEELVEGLRERFGIGLDLLPLIGASASSAVSAPTPDAAGGEGASRGDERLSLQLREAVLAYDADRKAGDPWSVADAMRLVALVEGELGRPIRDSESQTLREVEAFLAAQASEGARQRAALWRIVWEADIKALDGVDARISACGGNTVQSTRVFREQQRAATVRLAENLQPKKADASAPAAGAGDAAGSAAASGGSAGPSSRTPSAAPLPGAEARSASASDKKSLDHLRATLERSAAAVEANERRLREKELADAAAARQAERAVAEDLARVTAIRDELNERERDLQAVQAECQAAALRLSERQLQLESWEKALTLRESDLAARQAAVAEREDQHLADTQRRAEALQASAAAVLRREQTVEVREHVLGQRDAEVRRREEALTDREAATERRAEAIAQRSLELERQLAEVDLRASRVRAREAAIWRSYVNQQIASADPTPDLGASLGAVASDLKSVRSHLERLATVSGPFAGAAAAGHGAAVSAASFAQGPSLAGSFAAAAPAAGDSNASARAAASGAWAGSPSTASQAASPSPLALLSRVGSAGRLLPAVPFSLRPDTSTSGASAPPPAADSLAAAGALGTSFFLPPAGSLSAIRSIGLFGGQSAASAQFGTSPEGSGAFSLGSPRL
jgi:hypothetical protein